MRDCKKAEKEVLNILKEIRPVINKTYANTETILDETAGIKKVLADMQAKLTTIYSDRFNFDIQRNDTIDLICPIPEKVAQRSELVLQCKQHLDNDLIIHIYGTYKTGKSVLACLVAQQYQNYEKIRITLDYKNQISIQNILQVIEGGNKKVVIIDGLNVQDQDELDTYCRIFRQYATKEFLIIITSHDSFASISLDKKSAVKEAESLSLGVEDVTELFDESHKKWGELIYGITSGSPQLVQLALNFVESRNYQLNEKNLYDLFTFDGGMDLSTQCRKVLSRMLSDRESLNLLNRLLLLGTSFTREECQIVASVNPAVETPLTHLSNLVGTWIKENGDQYEISPLLRKALKPDLISYTKSDCCKAIADHIVQSKQLSANDVMRLFTLYSSGGLYDDMADLYIDTLCYLQSTGASDSYFGKLIKGFWHNMPLPEEMTLDKKIVIRSLQLCLCGISNPGKYDNAADELYMLMDNAEPDTRRELGGIYEVISYYYLLSGNVAKHNEIHNNIIPSDISKEINNKISPQQLLLLQLSQIRDLENLFLLMASMSTDSFEMYDMFMDGVNCAINNILVNAPTEKHVECLEAVIAKAYELGIQSLYPFAVSAASRLIQIQSSQKNVAEVERLYHENSKLLEYKIGELQLNYAIAVAFEENGLEQNAQTHFLYATKVKDLNLASHISLQSYLSAVTYVGKSDTQGAVDILCDFMKIPGFANHLLENQKMLFYGSLSIAYWFNKQHKEAIRINNVITDFVWRNRQNTDDSFKDVVIRQGLMLCHYLHRELHGADAPDNIPLMHNLYTVPIRDIFDLYSASRLWGVLTLTFTLNDIIEDNEDVTYSYANKAIEFCKIADSTVSQYIGIISQCIPLLLSRENLDGVEYMIETMASTLANLKDAPAKLDETFIYNALLQIACWRVIKLNKCEYFDDDRVKDIIEKYSKSIGKIELGEYIVSMLYDSTPDYAKTDNDILKTAAYLWHIDDYNTPDMVILMHRVFVLWSRNWNQKSLINSLNVLFVSIINHQIRFNPSAFSLRNKDVSELVGRALKVDGFEAAHKLIIAYNYLLQSPPEVHGELEDFLYA